MVAVARVDAAREAVGVVVGDVEGILEVAGPYDGEDGAEDLLLRHPGPRVDLEEGRGDEVALGRISRVLAQKPLSLFLARIYVARDLLELRLAYDGAHRDVHVLGGTDLESLRLLDDLVQHLVVDVGVQDGAGGGAALLPGVAVGAHDYVARCGVE